MGLVTVALLTLAPLALRPVRLACLIHAANVHSEPGSNPSKCGRPATDKIRPKPLPQNYRVEESDWSHRRLGRNGFPSFPVDSAAGFERPPSHWDRKPDGSQRATAVRRLPSRVHFT